MFTKRKVHAIGGARGFWSLPIRQSVKTSGISYEKPMNPFQAENDTLLLSTDANPSPGFSRVGFFFSQCLLFSLFIRGIDQIATRAKNDISIITRIPGTTIGAGPFFQRTAILHVMTNAIRVLEPGATSLFFCPCGTATLTLSFMQTARNGRLSRTRMAICLDQRSVPAVYPIPLY